METKIKNKEISPGLNGGVVKIDGKKMFDVSEEHITKARAYCILNNLKFIEKDDCFLIYIEE